MRINTELQASHLKKWVTTLLLLMVCLVLVLSAMPQWAIVVVLICIFFVRIYQYSLQKPATRLVQLIQFDKQNWRWSIHDPRRIKKSVLQEGRLLDVHHWFFVLVMRFETTQQKNNKPVIQRWVIWRDQVDVDHWRRLMVIARFWAREIPDMKS